MPNQASGTGNVTGLGAHAVRGIQLRRRRSRVPWIYLLYHVRRWTHVPGPDGDIRCRAETDQRLLNTKPILFEDAP